MVQSEASRAEMYLGLRQTLGGNVTSLLMERLPPDDFARSGEVQLLTHRVDNIASTMKVMIGSMITVSTVMIGLLVQIALSVR
jgi:hypothetical protein